MSRPADKLDFKPGGVVMAADLQALRDEALRSSADIRSGGGVDVRKGARGQLQITGSERRAFVGRASGDITARSGTTWGSGQVMQLGFDGSNDYDLDVLWDVVNPSQDTVSGTIGIGIPHGKYCFVQEDEQGRLIVAPLECP